MTKAAVLIVMLVRLSAQDAQPPALLRNVLGELIECDANAWYRWNGRTYEEGLYAVGDTISLETSDERVAIPLRARPNAAADVLGHARNCAPAKVLQTRGVSSATRWYLVELLLDTQLQGWIPAAFATESDCIGP